MTVIQTNGAPAAIGPYCQALVSGNLVFTSGQIALMPENGVLVGLSIEEQTEQVISNLKAILEAAGSSLGKVLKTTCFLADMNDFSAFNTVYAKHFSSMPARSTVAARQLPKNALVEIEVIAELV
jgi:2-iminobutanoate/2-iminopropanoate deaminase